MRKLPRFSVASLLVRIRHYGNYAVWAVGVWVAVGLLGYGLSLRSFAMRGLNQTHINDVGPANGKVDWVNSTSVKVLGYRFKLEKSPQTFSIPPEYVKNADGWADLNRYLVPGASVWFKASPGENLVLQMRVRRAFDEKELVSFEHVFVARKALPEALAERGMRFIWFAMAVLPVLAYLKWLFRRRFSKASD
ncbi:MAG: hypothetical protein NDJ90_06085 [Oligoflexia bacterium]|nr:hypothetical protein [Oligoflexia bacterium]